MTPLPTSLPGSLYPLELMSLSVNEECTPCAFLEYVYVVHFLKRFISKQFLMLCICSAAVTLKCPTVDR